MQVEELFSYPLRTELWDHRLVNNANFVIAQHHDLLQYKAFLDSQVRDRAIEEFKERKKILNDVQHLLKEEFRTPNENEKVSSLLKRLGLRFDEDGFITLADSDPPTQKYLGVKEPHLSQWERQIIEEEKISVIRRRDLKTLDEWLALLRDARALKPVYSPTRDWKEFEKKSRQRTERRCKEMAKGRRSKVNLIEAENDIKWKKMCRKKQIPEKAEEVSKSVKEVPVIKHFVPPPTLPRDGKLKKIKEDSMHVFESAGKSLPPTRIQKGKYRPKISDKYSVEELDKKVKDPITSGRQKVTDFRKRIRSSLVTSVPPGLRLTQADYQNPEIKKRFQKFQKIIGVHSRVRGQEDQIHRSKMAEKDYKTDSVKFKSEEKSKCKKKVDVYEDKGKSIDKDILFTIKKSGEENVKMCSGSIEEHTMSPKESNIISADQYNLTGEDLEKIMKSCTDGKQQESFKEHDKDAPETSEKQKERSKPESVKSLLINVEKCREKIEDTNELGSRRVSYSSIKKIEENEILKRKKDSVRIDTYIGKSKSIESFEKQEIKDHLSELLDKIGEQKLYILDKTEKYERTPNIESFAKQEIKDHLSELLDEICVQGLDILDETEKYESTQIVESFEKQEIKDNLSELLDEIYVQELDILDETEKHESIQNGLRYDISNEIKSTISIEDEDVKYLVQRLILNIFESDADSVRENDITALSNNHVQQEVNPNIVLQIHNVLEEKIMLDFTENLELNKIIQSELEDQSELLKECILEVDKPLIGQDMEHSSRNNFEAEAELIDTKMDKMIIIKNLVQDIINVVSVSEFIVEREVELDILAEHNEESRISVLNKQNVDNIPGRYNLNKKDESIGFVEDKVNKNFKDLIQKMIKRIPVSEIFIDRIEGINDLRTLVRTCLENDSAKFNKVQQKIDFEKKPEKSYQSGIVETIDDKALEEEIHKAYLENYIKETYFKKMEYINNDNGIENEIDRTYTSDPNSGSKVTPDIKKLTPRTDHLDDTDGRDDTDGIINTESKIIESVCKKELDTSEVSRKDLTFPVSQDFGESEEKFSENYQQEKLVDRKLSLKNSRVLEDSRRISTEDLESSDLNSSINKDTLTNVTNKAEQRTSFFSDQIISRRRSFEKDKDEQNLKFKHLFPIKSESRIKVAGVQNVKDDKNDEGFDPKPGTSNFNSDC